MSKPRILIVDDEVFFRRLFAENLSEGDQYHIETVSSGKEALDYLTRKKVDIILTDMVMPEICGLELIRRTRSFDPAPDIVLATGNATVETAIQALKSGARDYLLKPCNPEQLRHTIKSCLEQRRLLNENSLLQSQIRLYQRGQNLAGQLNVETLFQESLATLLQELGHGRGLAYLLNQGVISHIDAAGFEDEEARQLAEILSKQTADITHPTTLQAASCPGLTEAFADISEDWVCPECGFTKDNFSPLD